MLIFAPKPTKTHHISPIFRALAQKKKPILGLIIRCLATRAVTPVKNEAAGNNAPMYNLAGQSVDKGYKGIVIKNGKKIVLK